MAFEFDNDRIKNLIEQRQKAVINPRELALAELKNTVTETMTLADFVGICVYLLNNNEYVAETATDIRVDEIFDEEQDANSSHVPRKRAMGKRVTKEELQDAEETLMSWMGTHEEPASKADIIQGIMKSYDKAGHCLEEAALQRAFAKMKPSMKRLGAG